MYFASQIVLWFGMYFQLKRRGPKFGVVSFLALADIAGGFTVCAAVTVSSFLFEHSYPTAIPKLTAADMNGRELKNIVSFMLKHFDASLERVELNDLPQVFLFLGYPTPIRSDRLRVVGGPAWPHLLAALDWLVALLRYKRGSPRHNAAATQR